MDNDVLTKDQVKERLTAILDNLTKQEGELGITITFPAGTKIDEEDYSDKPLKEAISSLLAKV